MKSTTEKINEALGISSDESIDDVISNFDSELESIESGMKTTVEKIDCGIAKTDVHGLEDTFKELSDLIGSAKSMLINVYEYVSQSEILDPDVLRSGADLIKASREVIAEYLAVYKTKLLHYNNIEMEMLKFENKKKLEKYKHELKVSVNDILEDDMVKYIKEDVVHALNKIDKQKT